MASMDASIRNLNNETNRRMDNLKLMIYPFYLFSAAAVYAFADRLVPTHPGGVGHTILNDIK
jgi:hypothetical protein